MQHPFGQQIGQQAPANTRLIRQGLLRSARTARHADSEHPRDSRCEVQEASLVCAGQTSMQVRSEFGWGDSSTQGPALLSARFCRLFFFVFSAPHKPAAGVQGGPRLPLPFAALPSCLEISDYITFYMLKSTIGGNEERVKGGGPGKGVRREKDEGH